MAKFSVPLHTQINLAIQQLDQVVQQGAILSEEVANTSQDLTDQAEITQLSMAFFQINEENPVVKNKLVKIDVPSHQKNYHSAIKNSQKMRLSEGMHIDIEDRESDERFVKY